MQKLNKTFTATLQKSSNKGGWTFVIWPESVEFFKTRGLVKVRGTELKTSNQKLTTL